MNNDDESFDISLSLRKRLDEINVQKEGTQANIKHASDQLHRLLEKGKKKSRETPAQLKAKINDLERRRTTTSLPLAEEKDILRQISMIERTLVQIEENQDHECLIQQKKAEVSTLRTSFRSIQAQIAELESALSKVELAKRLGCSTTDLAEHVLDCPANKLGQVIGKNGSNLKQLEKETGCQIDVDKKGSQVHLHGSVVAIQAAVEELENITLSIEETVRLPEAVHTHLYGKRTAALLKLQSLYPKVHFDLSRQSFTITLRGKPEIVALVKDSILGINVEMETMKLEGRETALVLGKQGVTVKQLVEEHNVAIDVTKESGDKDSSVVKIVGTSMNVASAKAAIQDILFNNEEVEVSIIVDALTRNKLLSDSGLLIKQLQEEVKGKCNHNNTMMNFEKLSKEEVKSSSTSTLFIKAPRMGIDSAMLVVKARVESYEANIFTMEVDGALIPLIIGKKGETINKLRSLGPGAEIHVEKTTGEIKILGSEEATMAIKNAIDDIVANNQIVNVAVDESMLGLIFGHQGKELKEEIQALDVSMANGSSRKYIKLRGQIEKITEAASILRDFVDNNYTVEMTHEAEDTEVLMNGGANSILNKIQTDHGVKVTSLKHRRMVVIRGTQDSAEKAEQDLKMFLYGGNGTAVSKIVIAGNAIGMVIGKGGSNIAKLRSNHGGVTISVGRSSNCICIRGGEDEVMSCRSEILRSVATTAMSESLQINKEDYENFSKPGMRTKIISDIPVSLDVKQSSIKIRGKCADVNDAKALLEDFITGIYKSCVVVSPFQFDRVSKCMEELERIRDTTKTQITCEKNTSAVHITGKRPSVKKAKVLLTNILEDLFPSQFTKVKMAKPLVQPVGNVEVLAEIAAESGCAVSLDRDTNSLLLHSSCSISVSTAVNLCEIRIKDCEKLTRVIRIDPHESWLLPKFLGKGGEVVSQLQTECDCKISIWKDELMVCISGNDEENVAKAKQLYDAIANQARKEHVYFEIPESAINVFVGKSGSNMKNLAKTHQVQIERVKKSTTKIRVFGDETCVNNAISAVKAWVDKWEAKNKGNIMVLESGEIEFLLSRSKFLIRDVEKKHGVKIEADPTRCTVVVRSKLNSAREAASASISFLIDNFRNALAKQEAVETKKENVIVAEGNHAQTDMKKYEKEPQSTQDNCGDVVENVPTVLKDITQQDMANVTRPHVTQNKASSLFNLLISDEAPPSEVAHSHEQWDSSTVSSVLENDSVAENSVPAGNYYKSAGGFAVRL